MYVQAFMIVCKLYVCKLKVKNKKKIMFYTFYNTFKSMMNIYIYILCTTVEDLVV